MWSSNRHAREVQQLHAVYFHLRWRQESWSRHFPIYFKTVGNHLCKFKSFVGESSKKYCERDLYKRNIICVTLTNVWENYKTKIRHRISTWKQLEVQLLHGMNFKWKTFKTVASMKTWSTRESCVSTAAFHRYITCSIPVSVPVRGWRATGKKSTWKTKWSSRFHTEKFRYFMRCIFGKSVSR